MERPSVRSVDIGWMRGMFVGSLGPDDLALFEKAVEQGIAVRSYDNGVAGFMGLARVRFVPQTSVEVD